jgi:hypothetical protein
MLWRGEKGPGFEELQIMVSKSCFSMFGVLTLIIGMTLWFFLTTLGSDASPSSLVFSEETPSETPTPLQPTACPTIEYEVVASVAPRVKVGDTFVLRSSSSGFAGLAQTRLYIEYRLASVPDLQVIDPLPMIEVLPGSTGSSLGSGEFVLRALKPGTISLHTEVYGDAYFYSVGCNRGTEFKLLRSEPVSVSIEP